MQTLNELRKNAGTFNVQRCGLMLRDLIRKKLDFDVFLPTIGRNLQRPLVWSILQKRELVMSVLVERNIPCFSVIETMAGDWLVIDGKQRVNTLLSFLSDGFSIDLQGKEYKYSELPIEYQKAFKFHYLAYDIMYEPYDIEISDADKIRWFRYLNFAGTEMDKAHLDGLK